MQGDVKILYGGIDIFDGICPTPFLYFNKEYIENGDIWGSKYSFTLEGQVTGKIGPSSFYNLEDKKNKLISGFKNDNLKIEILEDGNSFFTSDICQIESVSFDQSKYYGVLPFSISACCYDSASFSGNYGVINPVDSWDYSESENGILTVKHSISADGFNSDGVSSIENAKKWSSTRTGISNKINSLKINNIPVSGFVLESFAEQIDRFNGKYSIEEVYVGDLFSSNVSGVGILRYAVDVSKNIDNGITTVSIDGSVVGKTNVGLCNMTLLRQKFEAEDFFNTACSHALASTSTNKLNSVPVTRKVSENINNSEITFLIKYDDNPIAPGEAKCIYKVECSENLIKKIVDVKIDAEILCDRGDQSVRWAAVNNYYSTKFNAYNLASKEYKRAGYSKNFTTTPKSESINFDEFNAKINYNASWSDRFMPYPDILVSISEKVDIVPSLNVYTIQPSLQNNGEHNVQFFGCATRASVSISIDATCRPDKSISDLRTCVQSELSRIKSIYVNGDNIFIDQQMETVNEKLRKMSVVHSYSFDGDIVK